MNRQEKAELIETLQTTLNASTTVVVAHQVGMTVAESSDLRAKMREAGAGFKVTKNRIAKLALKGHAAMTALESLFHRTDGHWHVGLTRWQPPRHSWNTPRTNDKLTIVGGSMDGKSLDKAGVEALAKCRLLTNCVASLSGFYKLRQPKSPVLPRLRPARWHA